MTDDLKTRLLALADDLTGPSGAWAQTDVIADALREAAAEIERLRRPPACEHRRYTSSPNARVRQCRDCFKTATPETYGWDWG